MYMEKKALDELNRQIKEAHERGVLEIKKRFALHESLKDAVLLFVQSTNEGEPIVAAVEDKSTETLLQAILFEAYEHTELLKGIQRALVARSEIRIKDKNNGESTRIQDDRLT
jgi:hypothetical protein